MQGRNSEGEEGAVRGGGRDRQGYGGGQRENTWRKREKEKRRCEESGGERGEGKDVDGRL